MEEKLVVFGDWHGQSQWALYALGRALEENPGAKMVHLGDFGFWDTGIYSDEVDEDGESLLDENGLPYTKGYVHDINELLEKHDSYLYVVLGNHENYWEIDQTYGYYGLYKCVPGEGDTEDNRNNLYVTGDRESNREFMGEVLYDDEGFIISRLFPRVKIIPRGHYWSWGDKNLASLGGATSIDRDFRVKGSSWWEEEFPTKEQADRLISYIEGREVDYLLTHEIPRQQCQALYSPGREKGFDVDMRTYLYSLSGNDVISHLVNSIKPSVMFSGHHHTRATIKSHTEMNVKKFSKKTEFPEHKRVFEYGHESDEMVLHILDRDISDSYYKFATQEEIEDNYKRNHMVVALD